MRKSFILKVAIDAFVIGIFLSMTGCEKDEVTTGTVTDIDGNVYKTVKIGTQWWMAENLKVTKYSDGTTIPLVTDSIAWFNLISDGYCYYKNDHAYKDTYGALYNWGAVSTGKLAPAGWHVPDEKDWIKLRDHLGGKDIAGGKLKETGTLHWTSPNTGATNESGFTALPAGTRSQWANFQNIGLLGEWWSSSEYEEAVVCAATDYYTAYFALMMPEIKKMGLSVRCIKY